MLKVLAADPSKPVLSGDGSFEYQFSADDATQFYSDPEDTSNSLTVISVRLGITPLDGIEAEIEKRKSEYVKPVPTD